MPQESAAAEERRRSSEMERLRADQARAKTSAASDAERCRSLEATVRKLEQDLLTAQRTSAPGHRDPAEIEREVLELRAALEDRERDARTASACTRVLEQELEAATDRVQFLYCISYFDEKSSLIDRELNSV